MFPTSQLRCQNRFQRFVGGLADHRFERLDLQQARSIRGEVPRKKGRPKAAS
jgi:hypothetical protein